jgi:methionyl-tRNA formyltransferase
MRIVFIGTGEIGVPTLRALQKSEHELVAVVTQLDKPVGREQKITAPAIKAFLLEGAGSSPGTPEREKPSSVPQNFSKQSRPAAEAETRAAFGPEILQPAKIKDPQAIEQIRALAPDVIVVIAYGQILPRAVLEIPNVACLNLHASLLPRWRGAAPIQAAIGAGDRETGITVMYMDEGLDTGDILLQRPIGVARDETGGSLHDRLAEIARDALLEALELLANGNAPRIPQDSAQATSAPKLNRDDGKIDWNESAEAIERKIRAYNPWPGTFTEIAHLKLKVFAAHVVKVNSNPGTIVDFTKEIVIAAKTDALSLTEVQMEGRNRMSAAEFLRGMANKALS